MFKTRIWRKVRYRKSTELIDIQMGHEQFEMVMQALSQLGQFLSKYKHIDDHAAILMDLEDDLIAAKIEFEERMKKIGNTTGIVKRLR